MTELIKAETYGLEKEKAAELTVGLQIVKKERNLLIAEFEIVSALEITEENLPKFKELRLKIVKNRTQGINKWHKANKEFFLIGGKFVDAIKHKESHINEEMEAKLAGAEQHFKNIEIMRLQELQKERVALLLPYSEFAAEMDLSSMQEDVFDSYLATKKQNLITAQAAAKKMEEERLAEAAEAKKEQDRLAEENRKLIDAQKKEATIRAERYKLLQPYLHYINDIEKALSASPEGFKTGMVILKAKAEKHAKIEVERKAKETEIRAKREAEEKKQAVIYRKNKEAQAEIARGHEAKKAAQKLAVAAAAKLAESPVKDQLSEWVHSFRLPECKAEDQTKKEIEKTFADFKVWALKQVNKM